MSIFDFFRRKKVNRLETNFSAGNTMRNINIDKEMQKHILTYIITEPETCFYFCNEPNNTDNKLFLYKEKKLCILSDKTGFSAFAFVWLIKKIRNNQEDFVRFWKILNKNYNEFFLESMTISPVDLVGEIQEHFRNFSLGNNPNDVLTQLQWTYIDVKSLQAFLIEIGFFIEDCINAKVEKSWFDSIRECSTINDLEKLIYADFIDKRIL